jgi:hypothetical protein
MLTAKRLRKVLSYAPTTGIFRWKVSPSSRASRHRRVRCTHLKSGFGHVLLPCWTVGVKERNSQHRVGELVSAVSPRVPNARGAHLVGAAVVPKWPLIWIFQKGAWGDYLSKNRAMRHRFNERHASFSTLTYIFPRHCAQLGAW